MTSHDIRQHDSSHPEVFTINGDISDELQIKSCIEAAMQHHGPINILIANVGITDEQSAYPIRKTPVELWQKTYDNNVRGTFRTIKAFLEAVETYQNEQGGKELENVAIVVTGSETGKFGQAGKLPGTWRLGKLTNDFSTARTDVLFCSFKYLMIRILICKQAIQITLLAKLVYSKSTSCEQNPRSRLFH